VAASPNPRSSLSRRGPNDPWFTIGTVDVTTALLIPLVTVVVWVAAAISTAILPVLWLSRAAYRTGFVWQLVTWPFASVATLAGAVGLFFFWSFGRIIEEPLGPTRFLKYLALNTVIVGIAALVLDLVARSSELLTENRLEASLSRYLPILAGPRLIALGVSVAVAAEFPQIRTFFNLPIRFLVAAFVFIEVLQALGVRYWVYLAQLAITLAVFLVTMRSFGLGSDLPTWIPRIPLPSWITGNSLGRRSSSGRTGGTIGGNSGGRSGRGQGFKRGSKGSGSVVTGPWGEQGTGTASTSATSAMAPRTASMTRADREEVDRLLDKIAQDGMGSLTTDERARLEDASRRLRESEGR
jgi:membrane associated rhomboid family serine protease